MCMNTKAALLARLAALELPDCKCEYVWRSCSCYECVRFHRCTTCKRDKHGKLIHRCPLHERYQQCPDELEKCEHVLEAEERFAPATTSPVEQRRLDNETLNAWAVALLATDPAAYAEPKQPSAPTACRIGGAPRVSVYAARVARGEQCFCAADLRGHDGVGQFGHREENGRECELDAVIALPMALAEQREWEAVRASDRGKRDRRADVRS